MDTIKFVIPTSGEGVLTDPELSGENDDNHHILVTKLYDDHLDITVEHKEKKSSFQITRVVSRNGCNDDSDSIDDRTGPEDMSSEVADISRSTNLIWTVDSEDTVYSSTEDIVAGFQHLQNELKQDFVEKEMQEDSKEKDYHSRFRVVKIDSQDGIKYGRWNCLDFSDSILLTRVAEEITSLNCSPVSKSTPEAHQLKNPVINDASSLVSLHGDQIYLDVRHSVEIDSSNNAILKSSSSLPANNPFQPNLQTVVTCSTSSSISSHPDKNHPYVSAAKVVSGLPGNSDLMSKFQNFEFVTENFLANMTQRRLDINESENPDERHVVISVTVSPSIKLVMATEENESGSYCYLESASPSTGCIVLVENEDISFSPDDSSPPLDSNWGTTYCRLRRASELIGASTVAIDNKIEQAMDLVKSHLMFAVREEVEQLKLKIQELTERNGQLEYENSILRASAPKETLAKLQKSPVLLPLTSS